MQLLKAAGEDAMTRLERVPRRETRHQFRCRTRRFTCRHAGEDEQLAALLGEGNELVCRYRTDIRRTLRSVRRQH